VRTEAGAVLSVRLLASPVRRLRVEGAAWPPTGPGAGRSGADEPFGRGLLLVDRVFDW
jgi:hypothetical protein